MTRYVVFYPAMVVHRADCADVVREARMFQPDTVVHGESPTIAEFLAAELAGDLDEMGYTAADFHVKPCAR